MKKIIEFLQKFCTKTANVNKISLKLHKVEKNAMNSTKVSIINLTRIQ